jgi:glyoxylase-like metal-dependent hydrolase (beta-lactamase superfamily II)
VSQAPTEPRIIDVRHLGREHVIGAWMVDGVLVDPGPTSCIDVLLAALGDERPRAIALTHIHLDHAGATGSLLERWPDLDVWVHEVGAPHLAAPQKLVASARRLYGEDMDRLWGDMLPVPPERLRIVGRHGGEEERIGDFRVVATPGHASHHVCYLHEPTGTVFAGDTAGVRIPGGPVLAPTPPPDIDVEAWLESIDRIAAWEPARLAVTHFGGYEDPGAHLDALRAYLREWPQRARELDRDAWVEAYRAWLREEVDPAEVDAVVQAAPPDQLWLGLDRYWSRRG